MASPAPFSEEINPIKLLSSNTKGKDVSVNEKVSDIDAEEHAMRIADDDANHKNKQVRTVLSGCAGDRKLTVRRSIQDGLLCGWRIKVRC